MPCSKRPLADGAHLLGGVHRAGRVRRRHEQQHLGARRAGRLKLLDGHEVVLVGAGEHLDGNPARELDRLGIGGPVRRGQQHLVARVEQGRERLVDGLLAAVGHDHLLMSTSRPLSRSVFAAMASRSSGRPTAGVYRWFFGSTRGLDGGLDDVVGCGEVRFAGRIADDGSAPSPGAPWPLRRP